MVMPCISITTMLFLAVHARLLLSASADDGLSSSYTISPNQVTQFLRDGWTTAKNAVPEMKLAITRENVQAAKKISELNFVLITYRYLKNRKDVDCQDYQSDCGVWNEHFYNYRELNLQTVASRTIIGMKFLNCCIRKAKENPVDSAKTPGFPYFQALNPHRYNEVVFDLAVAESLGRLASQLLQYPQIRLYQTALFEKNTRTLNQDTGWHQDLNMIPLDTGPEGYITFWCPLSPLQSAENDSLLIFASGSHRDVSLVHWYPSEVDYEQRNAIIADRYRQESARALDVGDCTAHAGWVYHKAHPQPAHREPRIALGFGFVSNRARVLPDLRGNQSRPFRPFTFEDEASFSPWIGDLEPMTDIVHPMLPLVFDSLHKQHKVLGNGDVDEYKVGRKIAMGILHSSDSSEGGDAYKRSESTSWTIAASDYSASPVTGWGLLNGGDTGSSYRADKSPPASKEGGDRETRNYTMKRVKKRKK